MDYSKQSLGNFAILSLLFAGILYLYNWSSTLTNPLFSPQKESLCNPSNLTNIVDVPAIPVQDELDSVLARASMENRTVIITIVNKAYAVADQDTKADTTMLDLFINSFWLGEDTRLKTDGVDFEREKIYMSQDFIKMMWTRTLFLIEILKRGYNFIFTDTDVMWLRNPFRRLSHNETEDLQISTDMYFGNPWSSENQLINTGFYFVRSNNKTIALFERWYAKKDNSTGQKEQDVLLNLIKQGVIGQLGLRVRFLDTLYFSGFCQNSKDFREVTTVHANCCRSITAKVADLKAVHRDWKRFKKYASYKRLSALNLTANMQWTGHFGCWNSWKTPNNNSKA
ncbi:Glycosyltransferase [Quillaja saponaria]|uniref:Glycosyltransferase n=1 Tax=Quillaja saponaria TaxID=32244 RepID=A0AAD7L351_QUISA|nr:Glycosyltransferase [Quillaja saponaria]